MGVTDQFCESGSVSLTAASSGVGEAEDYSGSLESSGSISLAPPTSGSNQAASTSAPSVPMSSPPMAANVAAGAAQKAIQKAAASSIAQGAGRLIQKGASKITVHVQAHPKSITLMSLIGGIVLTVVSFLNLLNILNIFTPLNWILQLYQLAAGLLIIVIDGPSDSLPPFVKERALSGAAFLLHNGTSRVLFYLFIACQQGSQASLFNWIVGWYFAVVAVGFAALQASRQERAGEEEGQPLPV